MMVIPSPKPTFSVIIPNLHSPIIAQVVDAIRQQTAAHHVAQIIIVGPQASAPLPEGVQWVEPSRPRSAAAARNTGAQLTHSDYLLFLDADCIAAPTLIERMIRYHQQGYAVVSGGVIIPSGPTGNYWMRCDNLLSFAPFLASTSPGPRPYLPSLVLSIDRTLFHAIGGFDEQFVGAAGEDVDISMRLRQQGVILMCATDASVVHCPSRTSAQDMWHHLRVFGRLYYRVHRRYPTLLPSALGRIPRSGAGMILAMAPALACYDVLRLAAQNHEVRQHVDALLGMIWGKMAWYLGAFEAMMICER